jgi:4,5-DOPA dioxygenase extradiol
MNALASNGFTKSWRRIGAALPRPKAILSISAHWYISGAAVTISTSPRTIHDFGGFPPELFQVQYPAPGDPELARRVQQLLSPIPVALDEKWGLDHGTWSVLCHVYPDADIPIVQLSINAAQPAAWHFDIGRRLAPLREEGILIAGSGNLVHNLRAYQWHHPEAPAYDWAARFEAQATEQMLSGETARLIDYPSQGKDAALSIPTPDHYLPLLYVLGTRQPADPLSFPVSGTEGGSISMLAVQVGKTL